MISLALFVVKIATRSGTTMTVHYIQGNFCYNVASTLTCPWSSPFDAEIFGVYSLNFLNSMPVLQLVRTLLSFYFP